MKTNNKTIGKIVAGCVLACSLTSNIQAQLDPGGTNSGSGGTNTYSPYGNFNPTPTITYPTNATLKWYLAMNNSPFTASLSLSPDGTLYIPVATTGNTAPNYLWAVNPSLVDTNDPNYPSATDFTNWVDSDNQIGNQITPVIGADGTVYGSLGGGVVSAINPTNGKILWNFNTMFGFYGQAAVGNDGTIYVPSYNYVYALTNAFGATNAFFSNTNIYPYSLTNVAIKWIYANVGNPFKHSSPAVSSDGNIHANTDGGQLIALNSTNGSLKWVKACSISGLQASAPIIGKDGTVYFGALTNLFAVNPNSATTNGIIGFKWIYNDTNPYTYSGGYPDEAFDFEPVIGGDGTIYVELDGGYGCVSSRVIVGRD